MKKSAKQILEDNFESKNDSFLFYLREKSLFNKEAFRQLYDSIRKVADDDVAISRTAQQIVIVYGQILQYFLYHFDKDDSYKIVNMPENYNKMIEYLDKSVEYYFKTRI
ncbi:MAG: hypothetical protein IKN71_07300 [Alphaproteobacteria bacterium]|nr:hypothetical protein [Alphaproteobacteria bacterium]